MHTRRVSKAEFLRTVQRKTYANAFEAFLCSAGSLYLLRQNLRNVDGGSFASTTQETRELYKLKQRYYTMISRLRQDGLLTQELTITQKGASFILKLFGKKEELPHPATYTGIQKPGMTLVTFDIPEKQRRRRAWLRSVLKNLEFGMLHKSVWLGKKRIPKSLIDDLKKFRLVGFVEILEISKQGTIKNVFEDKPNKE